MIIWKGYSEEENTRKPVLKIEYLKKLISLFHKNHPEKTTVTSPLIDSILPMARPIVKPMAKSTTKQKRDQLASSGHK